MERKEAEERVDRMFEWYVHLTIYASIIPLLAVVNVLTWRGVPWVLFAACGWGIGIVVHGVHVGTLRPQAIERWRREKVDELLRSSS